MDWLRDRGPRRRPFAPAGPIWSRAQAFGRQDPGRSPDRLLPLIYRPKIYAIRAGSFVPVTGIHRNA